ncbi:MAG TPA: F0F1 ATP synthase subunit B [Bacillota bacterium]|nr:F0F1 ATP synthase subunit B [Bacillota bacterium]
MIFGVFLQTGVEKIIEAVSKAIESAFGVTLVDLLIQLGATVVLVLIVRFFLWDKISAFIEKRKQFMANEIENAKKENETAKELRAKTESDYTDLKKRSEDIISQAKAKGEKEQTEMIESAKKEAARIKDVSQKEIEAAKEKARQEMKDEVIELAGLMAGKIIGEAVDTDKYVNDAIREIDQDGKK